jgi:hypothetical protein
MLGARGPLAAAEKMRLLEALDRARLSSARDVARLHNALLLLRTYPDDEGVLGLSEQLLTRFSDRADLRRFANALASSGIAGTPIDYSFYWEMAKWLASRWPERLVIDWAAFDDQRALEDILHMLLPAAEIPAPEQVPLTLRRWFDRLKGPQDKDGAFLVRRFDAIPMDGFCKEALWDRLDVTFRLLPARSSPSRTTARWPVSKISYSEGQQADGLDFVRAAMRPPPSIRGLSTAKGMVVIDLLREAMVTRGRDLEAIAYANANDVVVADCGDGLRFLGVSMIHERRFLFETLYVYLIVKNGVPIGYFQATAFLGMAELNYNIFPPFRGRGAAEIYAWGVSVVRAMLGVTALCVDPYQLGDGNKEALESGSFWFYYKLGFRPRDEARLRMADAELAQKAKDPNHRSSRSTLKRLANGAIELDLVPELDRPTVDVARIGLTVSEYAARRFGADRERATRTLAAEACELLGVHRSIRFSAEERFAWSRWAPIVAVLPRVSRWTIREKQALVGVIRAKGGRREHVYARRLNAHARLVESLAALSRGPNIASIEASCGR